MQWNILSPIMIIISRRRMYRLLILILRRIPPINDEIDKLRLSATTALAERRDVIIISSVSCIYGLGSPVDYKNMVLSLRPGMEKDRDEVIHKLIDMQYDRNDMDFHRGTFPRAWRCAGDFSGRIG